MYICLGGLEDFGFSCMDSLHQLRNGSTSYYANKITTFTCHLQALPFIIKAILLAFRLASAIANKI